MDIFNHIDWHWITIKIIFLSLIYLYYYILLKVYSSIVFEMFDKNFKKKIKSKNIYFIFSVLYATSLISIILLGFFIIFFQIDIIDKYVFNYLILLCMIAFLHSLKKAFLNLDNFNE